VAILGGVVSALALSKLYINLTEVEEESPESIIAGRGLTAMMLGVGYVWWELNLERIALALGVTPASLLDVEPYSFGATLSEEPEEADHE